MPTETELRQGINDSLTLFIDFIYALVFWQIVSEAFDKIIFPEAKTLSEFGHKFTSLIAVFALFYFLAWDWIHGRILTLRNPYKGYARFFVEIAIAICAYGAVIEVIDQSVYFLWYITLILLLGVLWAKKTLRDYPESEDKRELNVIIDSHALAGILTYVVYLILRYVFYASLSIMVVAFLMTSGWVFILLYEVYIPRAPGILAGPGVPGMSRKDMRKFRDIVFPILRPILAKIKKGKRDESEH